MAKLVEGIVSKIIVPEGKRDVLVFDDTLPGFGIRKFQAKRARNGELRSSASYFVKYEMAGGQQRRITLGAVVPGVLAEMRKKASSILAHAKTGRDIAGEKRAQRDRKVVTVGELIQRYLLTRTGEMRPRYRIEVERHLLRQWEPLHRQAIETISRRDLVSRIDNIALESGRTAADRAKSSISAFLAWCVERSYLELNPAIGISRRTLNGQRERVLSEAELVSIWKACRDDDHGRICKLLILTAQRKSEIGNLSWSEIDIERRQIDLPGARTKNKRPHIVPLADAALEILTGIPPRAGRDLVFGSGSGGFSGWSKSKAALDERLPAGMPAWTLHDIRRSIVTHLGDRGFALPHVREMLVNHQSGHKTGVAGIYDKSVYLPERRKALKEWGAHFTALQSK